MKNKTKKLDIKKIKKQVKGITLIALVVTIIVLLILAAVAINLTIGNNGIFTRAENAKEITEIAQWDERIEMAIAAKTMEKQNLTIDDIIQELIDEDIIDDASQVNKENGDITTNKPSYVISDKLKDYISNVKITISKTPETEMSGAVLLKVEKVEGLKPIDLKSLDITSLNETQKKELIKIMLVVAKNHFEGTDFKGFEDFLQYVGMTEPEFWKSIDDIEGYLSEGIEVLINERIQYVDSYTIINPENKISNEFLAITNGNYEFKVKEILTGKTYTETIEVTNIDINMFPYYVDSIGGKIYLLNRNDNKMTDFERAYIIYNGERVDITECISKDENMYIKMGTIAGFLESIGKVENYHDVGGTTQTFEILKKDKNYVGREIVEWLE